MRWLIVCVCFLLTLFVQGQKVMTVNFQNEMVNLAPGAEYLEDPDGSLTIGQILEPGMTRHFRPVGRRVVNFGITPSFFWVRTQLQNNTQEKIILELGNYVIADITFFEFLNNRLVNQQHTGNWKTFSEREIKNASFLFPLSMKKGEQSTVYLRVMHHRGTQFPLKAGTLTAYYEKDTRRSLMEGLYYGFMLLIILYNLFLYFSLRDSAYLYYVNYVFFMALLNATINGYAFRYLWPSNPAFNRYDDIIASFVGSAGVLFAAKFLNTKKNAPLFHTIFMCLLAVYLTASVLILSGYFLLGIVVVELNSLILVISFFMAAWHIMRNGYKPAKFFLIAWSFLLFSVFIFILNSFNLIPSTTFATHSIQIGSAVEALLLSFALANRINVYKEEKRQAELAALRSLEKNKLLILEQNMLLEKKVEERTTELKKANDELVMTLQNLKETQAQLVQKEKMASLGELTAGIAHEIQNPLNFVNNFSEVSTELVDELKNEIKAGAVQSASEIADDLKENLQKITYHGKRADSIVKGMLEHSRANSDKREKVALNEMVDEYLHLSYHGLRAADKNLSVIIETHYDENIGNVEVVAQDIGRVLLNIFNNAFYSLREKKKQLQDGYQPELSVCTRRANSMATICIRDNGIGIPKKVQSKIYQPFFTTKPAGEGTGLGLSLSYDIITKEHGGSLHVDTKEGQYAEFVIELPTTQ